MAGNVRQMEANRCGHCGREGTLETVGDVTLSSTDMTHQTPAGYVEEISRQERVQVERCSVCTRPTFREYFWFEPYSDPTDDLGWKTLYPAEHTVADLPPRIAQRYTEMLELLHAPDAFAVRAGRLLEAVCADQGVTTGFLGKRLDQLAKQIPDYLAAQTKLVKEYRNVGGHDDDQELDDEIVHLVRGFVEELLSYLYWSPAKVARATEEFAARQQGSGGGAQQGVSGSTSN